MAWLRVILEAKKAEYVCLCYWLCWFYSFRPSLQDYATTYLLFNAQLIKEKSGTNQNEHVSQYCNSEVTKTFLSLITAIILSLPTLASISSLLQFIHCTAPLAPGCWFSSHPCAVTALGPCMHWLGSMGRMTSQFVLSLNAEKHPINVFSKGYPRMGFYPHPWLSGNCQNHLGHHHFACFLSHLPISANLTEGQNSYLH